jgi:hypothetical protein
MVLQLRVAKVLTELPSQLEAVIALAAATVVVAAAAAGIGLGTGSDHGSYWELEDDLCLVMVLLRPERMHT